LGALACVRASASGRVHVVFVTILYYYYILFRVLLCTHTHTHVYNNIVWTPMCIYILYITRTTTTTTSARRCSSARAVHVNIFGRYPAWAHIVKNEKLPVTRTAVWPVGIVCFVFVSKLVKKIYIMCTKGKTEIRVYIIIL